MVLQRFCWGWRLQAAGLVVAALLEAVEALVVMASGDGGRSVGGLVIRQSTIFAAILGSPANRLPHFILLEYWIRAFVWGHST